MALQGRIQSLMRRYDAARDPFWALMSQAVTSGGNFLTTVIIIRAAGLGQFGRYSVCFLILMISRNFLNGMVLTPMGVISPKLRATTAAAYRGFLFVNGLAFGIGTSLLLYSGSRVLGWAISAPWLPELGLALALANFFANAADFLRRYQFATSHSISAFLIDAIRFAIQLALLTWLAFGGSNSLDANAAIYALAIGSCGGCLLGALVWGRIVWRRRVFATMWPRHANFIRWMAPGVALDAVQNSVPQFAATAILGEAAMGLIKAAQTITNMLNLPWNALQQVLPSMAAARLAKRGYDAMAGLLRKVGVAMGVMSLVLAIVIAALSPLIAEFLNVAEVIKFTILMTLYLTLNLVIAVRYPVMVLVNAVEDPSANFVAGLIGATVSVAASLLVIRHIGEISVPLIAIGNALVTWTVLLLWHRKRRGHYKESTAIRARGIYGPS